MPPRRPNPAAGKRPANGQTTSHTRAHTRTVNGKTVRVRASTRTIDGARAVGVWAKEAWTSPGGQRIRRTAVGTATSGTVCALILAEAGITVLSTLAVLLIAVLTTVAVRAGNVVERNRKTMGGQARRSRTARRTARPKAGARRTRR